jgi:Fe2+-dicitrate sensor, membrane component
MTDNKNNNTPKKDRADLSRKLVDGLIHHELPEGIMGRLRGWFKSGVSEEEKYDALRDVFEGLEEYTRHDENVERCLSDQHRRLGFDTASAPTGKRRISLARRWAIAAASTAAAVAVGFMLFYKPQIPTAPKFAQIEITALQGDERIVSLPDSSKITLGQGGRIHYAESFEENRVVYLEGEAFFSVAHMDGKPFQVISNSMTVTVIGTEFHVKEYNDSSTAEVKLASGSVSVVADGMSETMLIPGQHFVYEKEHQTITLEEIGEGELLRLLKQNLTLEGQSLDEAFRIMSQYFGVQFRIAPDLDLSERGAIGFEDDVTLDEALALLRLIAVTPFDYVIDGDTVTITQRK